jgi:hypothetical protein
MYSYHEEYGRPKTRFRTPDDESFCWTQESFRSSSFEASPIIICPRLVVLDLPRISSLLVGDEGRGWGLAGVLARWRASLYQMSKLRVFYVCSLLKNPMRYFL